VIFAGSILRRGSASVVVGRRVGGGGTEALTGAARAVVDDGGVDEGADEGEPAGGLARARATTRRVRQTRKIREKRKEGKEGGNAQKNNSLQIAAQEQRQRVRHRQPGAFDGREAHDVDDEDDGPDGALDDLQDEIGARVEGVPGEEDDLAEEEQDADGVEECVDDCDAGVPAEVSGLRGGEGGWVGDGTLVGRRRWRWRRGGRSR